MTPSETEMKLLRLVRAESLMSHDDERLGEFCDDGDASAVTDTFNACHELGWLASWHNGITDSSTVELTDQGKAILELADNAPDVTT